jgi:alkylated DNA nucleotide flippase Atl1
MPYTDISKSDKLIDRVFDSNIDPIHLKWHRDLEDRVVKSVETTDWQVQLEDQLPVSLNEWIEIPAGSWHRVIKGSGELRVKILINNKKDTENDI